MKWKMFITYKVHVYQSLMNKAKKVELFGEDKPSSLACKLSYEKYGTCFMRIINSVEVQSGSENSHEKRRRELQ